MRLHKSILFAALAGLLVGLATWSSCAQDLTNEVAALAPAGTTNTVLPVVMLKEHTKIWLTFGLNKVEFLQAKPFSSIPLWQYVASLIYVFLAFYISKFLDFFIRERLQKWAEKTENKFDDILVDLMRGPVKIVSFVVLLHIGMEVYSWPPGFSSVLSKLLKLIVAVSITYVLLKGVDAAMGVWRERNTTPDNEQFSKQLLPLIGKSMKVFLVIVVLLVTSQNLGLDVTGLIASLSIGGLAIGLAAQDTLANLFGAVAVLMDKPFKVGDRIEVEGVDGTVEAIGFRSTRIRNLDGHLVTVPNKIMGNSKIINISGRPTLKTVLNFGLTYDTPPEKVQRAAQIITETFRGSPDTQDLIVTFDKFTDSTLNLQVVHWWKGKDYKLFLAFLQNCNLKVKTAFDSEKIEFAFPTHTLYIKEQAEQS